MVNKMKTENITVVAHATRNGQSCDYSMTVSGPVTVAELATLQDVVCNQASSIASRLDNTKVVAEPVTKTVSTYNKAYPASDTDKISEGQIHYLVDILEYTGDISNMTKKEAVDKIDEMKKVHAAKVELEKASVSTPIVVKETNVSDIFKPVEPKKSNFESAAIADLNSLWNS